MCGKIIIERVFDDVHVGRFRRVHEKLVALSNILVLITSDVAFSFLRRRRHVCVREILEKKKRVCVFMCYNGVLFWNFSVSCLYKNVLNHGRL